MVQTVEERDISSLEISPDIITDGAKILEALSNEDAIILFLYAENGIQSSTEAIRKLGMTQKRYYSRLKGLIEVGLIEKVRGIYQHTVLGKMVHKLGLYLFELLNNRDRIKLLTDLTETDLLSSSEIEKITDIISEESRELIGLLDSIMDREKIQNVESLTTFEKLVEKVVEQIDLSESSILIATKYLNARVMGASLRAMERGVKLRCLFSKERLSSKLMKLKLMLSPKIVISLLAFIDTTDNLGETLREVNLPFSFVIIDDYKCFFELPSIGDEFAIAFYLTSEDTSKRFSNLFDKLWDEGTINAWVGFFEKIKKL